MILPPAIKSRLLHRDQRKKEKLFQKSINRGGSSLNKTFVAYQPDSHAHYDSHPEYSDLLGRFTLNNNANNAGDIGRLWSIILNCKQIIEEQIEGDFAELGVWRGNTAAVLAHYASLTNRRLFLFDTFEGFDKRDLTGVDSEKPQIFSDTSINVVKDTIGPGAEACEFVAGRFPDSIDGKSFGAFSIVNLDCDLYEPMKAGLSFFYPLLSQGGMLLLHDYSSGHWKGTKAAVDEFCRETGEHIVLMPDKSGSAFLRKSKR